MTASLVVLVMPVLALLWLAPQVPLFAFAGVLVAVMLRGAAAPIAERTGLPAWGALLLVVTAVGGLLWVGCRAAAPALVAEAETLYDSLPNLVRGLRDRATDYDWVTWVLDVAEPRFLLGYGRTAAGIAAGAAAGTIGALGNALVVFLLGFYLAAQPAPYLSGLRRLLAPSLRAPSESILRDCGGALRWWIGGQLIAMALVGGLSWVGLILIGMPLAGVLAVIAALLGFIPIVGPVLAAVPAVLLALGQDPPLVLPVAALYVAIQVLEGNVVTPLVQSRAVNLPPGLLLVAQLTLGLLFGLLGVALAAPLAAVTLVVVRRGYVEGWLEAGDGNGADPVVETRRAKEQVV